MKYYRHVSVPMLLKVLEDHYEFLTWGNPHWYVEGEDPWHLHSRDLYEEISESEAEEFVAEALCAEREAEERVFAEELGFDSYGELMEFAEEVNSGIMARPIWPGRWMAWRRDNLDPEDVVFGESRDEVVAKL